MAYAPTTWVGGVTKVGPTNLNHLEGGVQAAAAVADSASAAAAAAQTTASAALPTPAGSNGQFLKKVGGVWVPTSFAASDIPNFPSDASKVLAGDGTWPGGLVKIAETILGASQANFDFNTIPQTFRHLKVIVSIRTDQAVTSLSTVWRLNSDSGANYADTEFQGGTTVGAGESNSATAFAEIGATGTVAAASSFWDAEILLPNYARTDRLKTYTAMHSIVFALTTGQHLVRVSGGFWNSTAAISRLTWSLAAGNFVAGSTISVYGIG